MFCFCYSSTYSGITCRDWLADAVKAFVIRFGCEPVSVKIGDAFLEKLIAWSNRGNDGLVKELENARHCDGGNIFGVNILVDSKIQDRCVLEFDVTDDNVLISNSKKEVKN